MYNQIKKYLWNAHTHFVIVGDFESGLSFGANKYIAEDELVLILPIHPASVCAVGVLPHTQILTDTVLLEYCPNVIHIDSWNAGVCDEAVGDPVGVVLGIPVCYVNGNILKMGQTENEYFFF